MFISGYANTENVFYCLNISGEVRVRCNGINTEVTSRKTGVQGILTININGVEPAA